MSFARETLEASPAGFESAVTACSALLDAGRAF